MMPRTVEEILAQADDLARRFEEDSLGPGRSVSGASLRTVRKAFEAKARAERDLADAVTVARAEGHSWVAIGAMLGTSGEAARQRYGMPPAEAKAPRRRKRNASAARSDEIAGSKKSA
jgi:hypothetical protein